MNIRLITWNCNNAFRNKIQHIKMLKPDFGIIEECEPSAIDHSIADPSINSCEWFGIKQPRAKGIGAFSFNENISIAPHNKNSNNLYFFCPMDLMGNVNFKVIGVWTVWDKNKDKSYRQAHEGLNDFKDWIQKDNTVLMGDFNNNIFNDKGKNKPWKELIELLESFNLTSAYHYFYNEDFGKETKHTFYLNRKENSMYQIDYIFLPKEWCEKIINVEIGSPEYWIKHSDHLPLIIDLDF